ncbi:hypothetical protein [Pseudomonas guariconensis]|uniref:hypothetical protein n=1 Tax=Pseudomonas guariconensis TaxID=1288410 RepID=UPI00209B2281|nr:hypothetical protein [Pseudomonas guariconensis]MCO7623784.1 hypothetical protein [Pseudomonas guariconensis]
MIAHFLMVIRLWLVWAIKTGNVFREATGRAGHGGVLLTARYRLDVGMVCSGSKIDNPQMF